MKDWSIPVLAFLVGVLFGLPHFLIPRLLPEPSRYAPLVVTDVSFLTVDETYSSGPRLREVMEGRLIPTDPATFEHKSKPIPYYPLEVTAVGILGRWLGSVGAVYVAADFLLPSLNFLLLVWFLRPLTDHAVLAVFGSLAILSGGIQKGVGFLLGGARTLLGGDVGVLASVTRPLMFSQFPVPQASFLLLLAALILFLKVIEDPGRRGAALGSGATFGLLFYSYIYYWLPFGALVGIYGLTRGLSRDRQGFAASTLVLGTGAIVSMPYWVSFLRFRALPESADVLLRAGVETDRYAILPSSKEAVLIVAFLLLFWWTRDRRHLLILAGAVGIVAAKNIHLVTGIMIEKLHWDYRIGYIWQTVMLVTLLGALASVPIPRWEGLQRQIRKRFLTPALSAGVCVLLLFVLAYQVTLSKNVYAAHVLPSGFSEAFQWLNRNARPESVVVAAGFETSLLLPVYTHANVFLPTANTTLASTAELVDRLLLTYRLFEVPLERLESGLRPDPERETVFTGRGNRWSRERPDLLEQNLPWYIFRRQPVSDGEVSRIVERYRGTRFDPKEVRRRFRLDYVWEGPIERAKGNTDLNVLPFLETVYDHQGIRIYRVRGEEHG